MDHQPAPLAADEEVSGDRLRKVEVGFLKDRNALGACDPGEIAMGGDGHFGGRHFHPLAGFKDSLPAFAHALPAGDDIPSGVYAPDVIPVRPDFIHALNSARFERPVKRGVRLLDQRFAFSAHSPRKIYRMAGRIQAQPDD